MNIIEKDWCVRCGAKDVLLIRYSTHLVNKGTQKSIYKMCNECNTARLKKYRHTPGKAAIVYKATSGWAKRNRIKSRAHARLNQSLKLGKITKLPCSVCGDTNSLAHHHDYSKPLDVVWLCRTHHAEEHAKN